MIAPMKAVTVALVLSVAMLPAAATAQVLPESPASEPTASAPPASREPSSRPSLVPYEEGAAVPPGARVVTQARFGLIAAGASIFGVNYFVSALLGTVLSIGRAEAAPWLLAPVVGPFAYVANRDASSFGTTWLIADGVLQGAGLVVLIVGIANPARFLAHDRAAANAPRWSLTPGFAGGTGASLRVTF